MQEQHRQRPNADTFQFSCPVSAYKDLSKAEDGRQLRIGGIASTEAKDIQGEDILQDGLNWDDCLGVRGFFNNDHRKSFLDILGAPEKVQMYKAGEKLPDGSVPSHACTWIEGHLFDTEDGRKTWALAQQLPKLGRQLGMSVEGKVEQRTGPNGSTIAKARIQHVAITHQPVNQQCTVDALLRSLNGMRKGMKVGEGETPDPKDPAATSGRNLTREQLDDKVIAVVEPDGAIRPKKDPKDMKKRRKPTQTAQKSLSRRALLKSIYQQLPDASPELALALCRAMRRAPQE